MDFTGRALVVAAFLTSQAPNLQFLLPQTAQAVSAIDQRQYLRVEGSRWVAPRGESAELRGINLGGWLVTEGWMCGFVDGKDTRETSGKGGIPGRSTLENLEERLGPESAAALMRVWQDHWITTRDLDEIRRGGFNLIRVPFSFRTLQHADGSWIRDADGKIDFSRMDWIVREAAQRGIYTIFDLHVWPEQRLDYQKIGRSDGKAIREAMERLWTEVAAHYRGNGAIAAFDLINEFPGNWGVQQHLAQAVRKGDPNRVQVIEGYTFAEFVKLHEAGAFPNSVFSLHLYGDGPLSTDEIDRRLKETADSPVPVYVGEFLAADFPAATQIMNARNIAWSSWTYKTVDMGEWGTFNYYASLKTDIQNDSYQTIKNKWSNELTAWQAQGSPKNTSTNPHRQIATNSGETDQLQ